MESKTALSSTLLSVFALLLVSPAAAFISPYSPFRHCYQTHHQSQLRLYRKFHERAWITLSPDYTNKQIPTDLRSNSSPVKNSDSNVIAELRSTSTFPSLAPQANDSVLRLARSAFLETQTTKSDVLISPMTIHVLNFVAFPNANIRDAKTGQYIGLPIFGADIVSLPGNKHLVAIDFQPVLPLDESSFLLPMAFSAIESKLKSIHSSLQSGENAILPWGGDIPPQARRFFSPYALWTRLGGDNDTDDAINKVETFVWEAFQEYLDLYMDMMKVVQQCVSVGLYEIDASLSNDENPVKKGQMDYLEYRRVNDPARPMLRRLYGEEWTERVIDEVLFPSL
ncbi:hypothetical protein ACHAWO_002710 [Cyclotella atomus]|uniref:Phycoerythrobilin:ferredoxin oxidoreductase n=1 Tax=Cyclotella atomus TaxID=382360 RepID=A0ABD3NNK6_9STRA